MKECMQVEAIVRRWEEEGMIALSRLATVRVHCASCAGCTRRYAGLIALLERDAGVVPVPAAGSPPQAFTASVMRRIGTAVPRMAGRTLAWAAMAAACFLLVAGIGTDLLLLRGQRADEILVHFQLEAPGATSVALVGSFTEWSTTKLPMVDRNHEGVWEIEVRLKKDTTQLYNFVIDGSRWVPDPRSAAQVDDGFGGLSSVLQL